eukprot:6213599-Pleurochrysis_carterae.AAC.3
MKKCSQRELSRGRTRSRGRGWVRERMTMGGGREGRAKGSRVPLDKQNARQRWRALTTARAFRQKLLVLGCGVNASGVRAL